MEGGGQAGRRGGGVGGTDTKKKGARVTESNAVSTVAAIARVSTTKQGVCVDDHLRPQEHAPPPGLHMMQSSAPSAALEGGREDQKGRREQGKSIEWSGWFCQSNSGIHCCPSYKITNVPASL